MGLRRRWRSWRRTTRIGIVLLLVLVGVPLLALLSVTTAPVRSNLLTWGAGRAAESLPGELSWSRLEWPAPGRIELREVLWSDHGDTVAYLGYGVLEWNYEDLKQKQLDVRTVELATLRLDVPGLQKLIPPPAPGAADSTTAAPFFPGPGSIPGLPGIGLQRLAVTDAVVRADSVSTFRVDSLGGHFEARAGHDPLVGLEWVRLWDIPLRFASERGAVRYEPGTRHAGGDVEVEAPGAGRFRLRFEPAGADSTRLALQGELEAGRALDLTGTLHLPDLQEAALRIRGSLPELELEDALLTLQAPPGWSGTWRGEIRALARDLGLQLALEATPGDSLQALLSPLVVRAAPTDLASWAAVVPRSSLVISEQGLHLARWPVLGDLGELALTARLDEGRRGRIRLEGEWAGFPRALPLLATLPAERMARLRADWPTDPVPRLDLTVEAQPGPQDWTPQAVRWSGSLRTPGPARLISLLAQPGTTAPVDLHDWIGLEVRTSGSADWSGAAPRAQADLDLGSTSWLNEGRLSARYDGRTAHIDSLVLDLEGLRLTAAGAVDSTRIDLAGQLRLADARLLERSDALAGRIVRLAGQMDWTVGGSPLEPEATADLQVAVESAGFVSEDLSAQIRYRADGADVALRVDDRIAAAGRLDLEGAPAGRFAATVDSMRLAVEGYDLVSEHASYLRYSVPDSSWSVEGLDLAGSMGTAQVEAAARRDSLSARVRLDLGAPRRDVAAWLPDPPALLLQDGRVELACEVDAELRALTPRLDSRALVRLTGDDRASEFAVAARAEIDPAAADRLRLEADVTVQDSTLARAAARVPIELSLQPPAVRLALEDSTFVDLHSAISNLGTLSHLLPAGIDLGGSTRLDLRAAGRDTLFGLDGRFAGRDLRVDLADGSWAELEGGLRVQGTSAKPVLEGDLKIEAGLIQLPEVPATLLPTSGAALLWPDAADAASAAADTTPAPARQTVQSPAQRTPTARDVALEFLIECPGNLWLRGQGLEVELEGELNASWQDGRPALVGRLGAKRGTFRFLGRVFTIERGEATFLGDLATDPYLDLALTARLGGVDYRIELTGAALKPSLALSSEPEMSQGDIMASLLFGKPLDELDEGQEQLLRQRAGQVLLAYGAVRLQDQLSRRLGVDLVTINQGVRDDQASSLVLGKYLSPKVLLSYEQFLDADSTFRVRLEYNLSRSFDIETTVGQGDASGIDLLWSRDY